MFSGVGMSCIRKTNMSKTYDGPADRCKKIGAVQLVQLQVAQTPFSDHRCYGLLEAWRPLRPRILHIKEAASVVEQAWWQELSHATTCSGAGNPSALQCLRCNEHHQHPCLILQD